MVRNGRELCQQRVGPTHQNVHRRTKRSHRVSRQREDLKSTESNGTVREPTEDEQELHAKYIEVKIQNDVLNAQSQILKAKLMAEMGQGGGVNGILKLVKELHQKRLHLLIKSSIERRSKRSILNCIPNLLLSVNQHQRLAYDEERSSLNKQDPELRALEKSSKESCDELKAANSIRGNRTI